MAAQPSHQQRPFNNGYLPNGNTGVGPMPGGPSQPANQNRVVQAGTSRILCVADVRGNLRSLNDLAKSARADFIIHTGDFGFYDERSLDRIAEKTLKHVAQYSPLITEDVRYKITHSPPNTSIKDNIPPNQLPLSQLPLFLNNTLSFDVPVYTVWGACEDVQVLEKLRSGEYKVDKLHIIDEAHSDLLEVGGVKLRLLGLGGAVVMHKLFDNGEGRTTIAGGQGTMWTTLLQMGELVDTANRVYDPCETRVLVTHASPAREGLLNQLSVALKVDFSISAGLHFRYGSSYNEFSVNPTLDHYRGKLAASKASFNDVWETVKSEVEPAVAENEAQAKLLSNAIDIVNRMPSVASGGHPFGGHGGPNTGQIDEMAFKNMWNFNLADAAFGWLVLEVEGGRIGTEMRAHGFNFAHRGMKNPVLHADMIKPAGPNAVNAQPTAVQMQSTQAPQAQAPPRPTGPPQAAAAVPPPQGFQQSRQNPQMRQQPSQQATLPRAVQAVQQGPSPAPAPSQQAQQTPQPSKGPPAVLSTTRPTPSPAPPSVNQNARPTTQHTPSTNAVALATTNGTQEKEAETETKINGTATGEQIHEATSTKETAQAEKKPSSGIFVQNVSNEEEVKNLFSDEDKPKIVRVERRGKAFIAHFGSPDEMQAILKALPQDLKERGGFGKPNVKMALERPVYNTTHNTGSWNSRRDSQPSYRNGPPTDSDGARGGRGGGVRGRGRGGTERGRGRGRGGPNKGESGATGSDSPVAAPPTST